MHLKLDGLIHIKTGISNGEFHEKLHDWIAQNGWESHNAGAIEVPGKSLIPVQVGSGTAVFHPDYSRNSNNPETNKRYFLSRTWDSALPTMAAFMMNPSSANELSGDGTVDFMVEFAKCKGYGTLQVVNTSPIIKGSNTDQHDFQADKDNWDYIEHALTKSDVVVLGWGEKGQKHGIPLLNSTYPLAALLERNSAKLRVFAFGKENSRGIFPKHPHPQKVDQRFPLDHELMEVTAANLDRLLRQ